MRRAPMPRRQKSGELGVGQHVMAKTIGGEELRRNITVIGGQQGEARSFKAAAKREMAYSQVATERENPGNAVWILLLQ